MGLLARLFGSTPKPSLGIVTQDQRYGSPYPLTINVIPEKPPIEGLSDPITYYADIEHAHKADLNDHMFVHGARMMFKRRGLLVIDLTLTHPNKPTQYST